jgi:Cell division protein ZapA.
MGKLQIDILGASFAVQAKEDDAYLKKLLGYYKEITDSIQKSGNLKNPVQISILAGITLVDELYKEKTRNASYQKELSGADDAKAEQLTMQMIETIDRVLGDDSSAGVQNDDESFQDEDSSKDDDSDSSASGSTQSNDNLG